MTPPHVARSAGGDGPPVLLLHGFGTDHAATWIATGWTRALERAGRAWIAPDLPGHGASEKPADPAAYSPDRLLAAVTAALGEHREADIVGYSLGGRLAVALALAEPGRVRRLVAGGIGADTPFADAGDPRLAEVWAAVPDADRPALEALAAGYAPGNAGNGIEALTAPTLLFAGADDELAAGLPALAARIPGAELLEVPGRTHRTTLSASAVKRRAVAFLEVGGHGAARGVSRID